VRDEDVTYEADLAAIWQLIDNSLPKKETPLRERCFFLDRNYFISTAFVSGKSCEEPPTRMV